MSEYALETMKTAVLWPERYHPRRAEIYAQQTLAIAAPPETVWAWLVRAEDWPAWLPGATDVHFLSHAGPDLRDRSRLRWTAHGRRLTLKVLEFEPGVRLGWDVQGLGVEGYHGWVLTPAAGGGTQVVSEEVRCGWRTRLTRLLSPGALQREQTRWLDALRVQAQRGLPGTTPQ